MRLCESCVVGNFVIIDDWISNNKKTIKIIETKHAQTLILLITDIGTN